MSTRQHVTRLALPCVAATLLAAPHVALAQDLWSQQFIKPGDERFTFTVGGILNQFNTEFTLNGQGMRGTSFDLETNNLAKTRGTIDAAFTWRFASRHRFDAEYFQVKRSGTQSYSNSITIGDDAFPLGATVSIEAETKFLLADYRYSFLKRDDLELAGAIGLYGGRVDFATHAQGNEAVNARSSSSSSSTTVPLPTLGVSVDWYVNPRLKFAGYVGGMKAEIGDVDGRVLVGTVTGEYMFSRNFGLGLRYMYTDIDVDVTKSSFTGTATWRLNSASAYLKMMF